jgi:hypothetical protein
VAAWPIRSAASVAALMIPLNLATAGAPDDSGPSTSDPVASPPDGDGQSSGPPPGDPEFQVDMILGLVPEDEMQDYWNEQGDRQQLAIQACMNEAGFEYVPENPEDMIFVDPLAELSPLEYAEQWGFGVYTMMDPESSPYSVVSEDFVWPNQEVVDGLTAAEQNAWFEVNNRCSTDAYTDEDPFRNPMVQQAIEDFYTEVESDPRVRSAVEAWRACMEAAGHPFASQDDMYEEMYDSDKQDQFWESEAWEPDSADHAEWQSMVEREIGIAVANAECGPPLEDVRQVVVRDLRPGFAEVWQTIDWSLPPVTYPGEGDMMFEAGDDLDHASMSTVEGPVTTDEAPVAIDLSEPTETSSPATSVP